MPAGVVTHTGFGKWPGSIDPPWDPVDPNEGQDPLSEMISKGWAKTEEKWITAGEAERCCFVCNTCLVFQKASCSLRWCYQHLGKRGVNS